MRFRLLSISASAFIEHRLLKITAAQQFALSITSLPNRKFGFPYCPAEIFASVFLVQCGRDPRNNRRAQ